MKLSEVFDRAIAGTMTLQEVRSWVEHARPEYQRPPLRETADNAGAQDRQQRLEHYFDWSDRIDKLNQCLQEYAARADSLVERDSNQALLIARVMHIISELVSHQLTRASFGLKLGYFLWGTDQYYDASLVLTEAVAGFQSAETVPELEVAALRYLCDSLYQDAQFGWALSRTNELNDYARQHGFRGYSATALYLKGRTLERLGRADDALDCLRQAIQLREALPDQVVDEQSVRPLDEFLDAYGQAARQFGRFEEAITTFDELANLQALAGDLPLQARAISDIGYTYLQAGEKERAIRYLRDAAILAEKANATHDMAYWGAQADLLAGNSGVALPNLSEPGGQMAEQRSTYRRQVQMQLLISSGHIAEAEEAAQSLLEWAQRAKDTSLEISIRNTLAFCYLESHGMARAIREFQEAIRLADRSGNAQHSIMLRYNLARAYYLSGKDRESLDVIDVGIAFSQSLLDSIESSEFRQQVIADSIGLYELYALIVAPGENHIALLSMTEAVRARNLYRWLRVGQYLENAVLSTDILHQAHSTLRTARAVEVELEVRHQTSQIGATDLVALQQRREYSQSEITRLLNQAGLQSFSWKSEGESPSFRATELLIDSVLQPDTAIVCFFSIREGICPVVLHRRGSEVVTQGQFIEWDRSARLTALAQWSGNVGVEHEHGRLSVAQRDARRTQTDRATEYRHLLGVFQEHLLLKLATLLDQTQAQRLVVIPHRELALIPYWDLLDHCQSLQSLTVAPSLNVLNLCLLRRRPARGPSVLVSDLTGTLAQAGGEIEMVRRVRRGADVVEADSIAALQRAAEQCTLLHIAAHGLFNPDNPYYSGLLAGRPDAAKSIFAQYAALPSFHISAKPESQSIRLLTVAECMAELPLDTCRLAILSTCESGIARQHGGGELTGLPNALLVAGAKSVIASLWPVHDTATALLMHYFYDVWEGGSGNEPSPARALAEARRRLRAATREDARGTLGAAVSLPPGDTPFSHPIYSDAFHCFGSW